MGDPERENPGGNGSAEDEDLLLPPGVFSFTGYKPKQKIDANPADARAEIPPKEQNSVDNANTSSWSEKYRRFCERWGLKTDRIIELVFSLAIVIFAFLQWQTAVNNNTTTTQQTDQLIAASRYSAYAADRNAQAAQNFAVSAEKINKGIDNAVTKLQVQAEEMDAARTAAESQSQQSLQATITNAHDADRAWVTATGFNITNEENRFRVSIGVVNSGRTPALEISGDFKLELNALNGLTPRVFAAQSEYNGRSILAPGPTSLTMSSDVLFLNPGQVDGYKQGQLPIFIDGIIWYKDVYKRQHWTKVCAWHTGNMPATAFAFYWLDNEVDQRGESPNQKATPNPTK